MLLRRGRKKCSLSGEEVLGVGLVDDVIDNFVGLIYVLVWDNSVKFDDFLSEIRRIMLG